MATPSSNVPLSGYADDALQEYLDLLLKPVASSASLKPYAEPAPRPPHRPLPPLAPPPAAREIATPSAALATETVARALPPLKMPVTEPPPCQAPPVVEQIPPVVEQIVATAVVEATPAVSTAPTETAQPTPRPDALQPAAWAANGRPQWAQQRFEALLFSVGGLNLAVPLVELGAIHALENRELTPLFGQIDWFLGLLPLKEGSLRVVDSARVVMPERYDPAMPSTYRYVITLSGSDWGLGVDTIHDSVQLEPDAVRWRSARGKRPWLAGTVVEQMCALLDASQLTWMFHSLDRHRGARAGARL